MEKRGLRNNYVFALAEFVLFLIIFCFLVAITKQFHREMIVSKDLKTEIFFLSIFLGTVWFVIYIVGLFLVGYIAKKGTIKKSTIFWLPMEKPRTKYPKKVGLDFLSLEDIDL